VIDVLTAEHVLRFHILRRKKVVYGDECHKGSPAPKKFKTAFPVGEVMLTGFWSLEGVVHSEFVSTGTTINCAVCVEPWEI
jgi:hypothetical protein